MKNQERWGLLADHQDSKLRIQYNMHDFKSAQIWFCSSCRTLTFTCQRRRSLGFNLLSVCLLHFPMQMNPSSALERLSELQPRADRPAYRNSAHCAQFCPTLLYAISEWHTTLRYIRVLYYSALFSVSYYSAISLYFSVILMCQSIVL